MKSSMFRLFLAALLGTLLAGVGTFAPAHAATKWSFTATSGATQVKALGTTITSDLTASSGVTAMSAPTDQNSTAAVSVAGLLSTGAVQTTAERFDTPNGTGTRTVSRLAGLNLLGGLIHADAVKTTVTTYLNDDGTSSTTGGTEFVNLRIVGHNLPVEIPKNYFVGIPGVAMVALNYFTTTEKDGSRATFASGLSLALLEKAGEAPRGARVNINPAMTMSAPAPTEPDDVVINGNGYATQIKADAGNGAVKVDHGPTAIIRTPSGGSNGETLTNSTAAVKLAGVIDLGAVETTTTSTKGDGGDADVTTTSEVARVNLLNGLVEADAIKVTAHGQRVNGTYSGSMDMEAVNLTIAGTPIDLDVAPNTTINIANLGKVVINEQATAGPINRIRAVHIVLDTSTAGLPVGASIELAVAGTAISWAT